MSGGPDELTACRLSEAGLQWHGIHIPYIYMADTIYLPAVTMSSVSYLSKQFYPLFLLLLLPMDLFSVV